MSRALLCVKHCLHVYDVDGMSELGYDSRQFMLLAYKESCHFTRIINNSKAGQFHPTLKMTGELQRCRF